MGTTSYQSVLTDAIKVTLGTLVMDPVTGRVMRGEEVLRLVLLRMSDNGNEEATQLLQVMEENHRRKRRHHRQKGHTC